MAKLVDRPGVRAIALVGSRGSDDPDRIDIYSDVDLLVCCEEKERARLLAEDWSGLPEPPVLVFPRIMADETRLLFSGLFACELHLLTPDEVANISGKCRLGSYLEAGFRILHDPNGYFRLLASRVEPEPSDNPDPTVASSVFWYNMAYTANLVARGDLFRASQFSNWYLPLFLLNLLYSIEEPDATKYVMRKVRPHQYQSLAATIAPLDRKSMIAGLRHCMSCYWEFQAEVCPEIEPAVLSVFHRIERDIERRLEAAAVGEPGGATGVRLT